MQIKEMYRLIAEEGKIIVDPNENEKGPVVDLAPGISPEGYTEADAPVEDDEVPFPEAVEFTGEGDVIV